MKISVQSTQQADSAVQTEPESATPWHQSDACYSQTVHCPKPPRNAENAVDLEQTADLNAAAETVAAIVVIAARRFAVADYLPVMLWYPSLATDSHISKTLCLHKFRIINIATIQNQWMLHLL